MMDEKNIILENILNRKSVREYTDKEINRKILEDIVRAGMSAPSALNLQPWHFIVFDDKNTLVDMADVHEYSGMFKDATAGILVCGDMDKTVDKFKELWVQDCSAATENILLACEAFSIGAVWLGIYPIPERCDKLSKYFKLPENIVPFALVSMGYPLSNLKAKDKWDESKIHWDNW